MRFHRTFWIFIAAALIVVLGGCSLAEDVTPPPNYRPPTVAPTQAVDEMAFPLVPPDPQQGAALYAEKCQPCHGDTGMGDGPQASNLPNPAAPIGSPEQARSARPVDWYRTVTQGNLDRFMPGFSGSLSDSQRWDVVAYAFSLSASPDELAKGQAMYAENCASCHGETGLGDGPQAASLDSAPVAWSRDQSRLARLSADDIVSVTTGAKEGHPTLDTAVSQVDRYALAAFIRSLSFSGAAQPAQASAQETPAPNADVTAQPTLEGTAAPAQVTIRGKVTSGTPGGALPENMQATLLAFSGMNPAFDQTADVASDGSYAFEGVQYDAEYVYMVTIKANGLTFNSDVLHGGDIADGAADLPVKVYDTTTDNSNLSVDRLHVFFDFSKAGTVQIVNLLIISNPSDQVVVPAGEGQPVVQYVLPEGATNLQFDSGEMGGRYVTTQNGFGDTMAIAPGSGQQQVLFAYDLPYDRKLDLTLTMPLPVQDAIIMLPPGGVKLNSDQLMDAGQRDVQGMSFHMYQTTTSLAQGGTVKIGLSGKAGAASAAGQGNEMNYLLVGMGGLGLALVGAGVYLFRRRASESADEFELDDNQPAGETVTSEALLDDIVALDDLHAAGKLPEPAYQERRAELKARLAEAIDREQANGGSAS